MLKYNIWLAVVIALCCAAHAAELKKNSITKELYYTVHSLDRMAERGVTKKEVKRV